MKCPVCKETTLQVSERQGIEIDHCPDCRGVWLDRGELDKILERSMAAAVPRSREEPSRERDRRRDDDDDDDRWRSGGGDSYPPRRKRRESWLGELFDFG